MEDYSDTTEWTTLGGRLSTQRPTKPDRCMLRHCTRADLSQPAQERNGFATSGAMVRAAGFVARPPPAEVRRHAPCPLPPAPQIGIAPLEKPSLEPVSESHSKGSVRAQYGLQ